MGPLLSVHDINNLTSYEFETLCRNYARFANLQNNLGVTRVLTRYKMFVDLTDISLVPHLILDGFWETPVSQCLAKLVREGDVCIDVGAHLGYFSILMSALSGANGRTIAVEPNPVIAATLRKTSGINHPSFEVWEGAFSDRTGQMEIHVPHDKSGDASLLIRNQAEENALMTYRVSSMTVDRFAEDFGLRHIDVMKIDAEGAEPMIFEGMPNVLKDNPELKIVMEYSPHLYSGLDKFNVFLLEHFDLYQIFSGFILEKVSGAMLADWRRRQSHIDLLLVPRGFHFPEETPDTDGN